MLMPATRTVPSPVGTLTIAAEHGAITAISWGEGPSAGDDPALARMLAWLDGYFAGRRSLSPVPLRLSGPPFYRRAWAAMQAIPPGRTASYGALALEIGGSPRAIGMACAANRLPLIIPCHRVLAAGGRLGGYSGGDGLSTKRWLLAHEAAMSSDDLFSAARGLP